MHHFHSLLTCVVLFIALHASVASAAIVEFNFSGQCDDCAFAGDPGDPGFDPFDDGLFQPVSGTVRLVDPVTNGDGLIEVDSGNFHSFSYSGSNLINPFSFDDAFLIRGLLTPDGAVHPSEALHLETSDGPGGSFDFPNFCTELGAAVLEGCGGVGLVTFELTADGDWSIAGTEAFDVGVGGSLSLVPLPGALYLMCAGVAVLGLRRRRALGDTPARAAVNRVQRGQQFVDAG